MSDLLDAAEATLATVPRFDGDELLRAVLQALCDAWPTIPGYALGPTAKQIIDCRAALLEAVPEGATEDPLVKIQNRRLHAVS